MVRSLSGSMLMTARKRFLELAVLALNWKVMLMMNQRRRQHLFGKLEELARECAGDDRRILDQIGHFVEEARVLADDAADATLEALGFRVECAGDLVVALATLENDEVFEEPARGIRRTTAP